MDAYPVETRDPHPRIQGTVPQPVNCLPVRRSLSARGPRLRKSILVAALEVAAAENDF